jgi:aryl-alcohol dehydrogenase-like predicted oxidoreductase
LIDTGDFSGMGHNQLLLRDALRGRRQQLVLSVKFGALRDPDGRILGNHGRPRAVKNFLGDTLTRLGTDDVDVDRPARVDPTSRSRRRSAPSPSWWRRARCARSASPKPARRRSGAPSACIPSPTRMVEDSLVWRGIEAEILPTCRALGVGVTAYGVRSRGLLGGHWSRGRALAAGDVRRRAPRFSDQHLDRNLSLVERLRGVAAARGATPAQLAIAWVLARGGDIVALVGARTRQRLGEALGALDLELGPRRLPSWSRRSRPRPSRASATTPSRWRCSTANTAPGALRCSVAAPVPEAARPRRRRPGHGPRPGQGDRLGK